MPGWRAIVFDLDDTLYPEREYVVGGFAAVGRFAAERLGIPYCQGQLELQRLHAAGVRGDTFDRWIAAFGGPALAVPSLVEIYRAHQPRLEPFPGIADLLAELRERCRLGLVSDGHHTVQRRKLAALGFLGSFDAVVFSDELGREHWKPSPRPFVEVCCRLGVRPNEAVYVADNPVKDFLGARAGGLASIWCRYSGGDYAGLEPASAAHAPDATVQSVGALRALLLAAVGPAPAPTAARTAMPTTAEAPHRPPAGGRERAPPVRDWLPEPGDR